jgi:hypothetical protein
VRKAMVSIEKFLKIYIIERYHATGNCSGSG